MALRAQQILLRPRDRTGTISLLCPERNPQWDLCCSSRVSMWMFRPDSMAAKVLGTSVERWYPGSTIKCLQTKHKFFLIPGRNLLSSYYYRILNEHRPSIEGVQED